MGYGVYLRKDLHAMLANSIPIYWGSPGIAREFNSKSFISAHDSRFTRPEDIIKYLVDRVIELDTNDTKYLEMLQQPWLPENKVTPWLDQARYTDYFSKLFSRR